MPTTHQDPPALLLAWGGGDQAAFEALLPLVHDELRRQPPKRARRRSLSYGSSGASASRRPR